MGHKHARSRVLGPEVISDKDRYVINWVQGTIHQNWPGLSFCLKKWESGVHVMCGAN